MKHKRKLQINIYLVMNKNKFKNINTIKINALFVIFVEY